MLQESVVRLLTGDASINNECAIPFISKVTPCPSVKNAISQYLLGASWCCQVLAGNEVPHLEWRNAAGVSKRQL